MKGLRYDEHGALWCRRRKSKRAHESFDQALRVAFLVFVETGLILTPYKCGRTRIHKGVAKQRPSGNPWGFEPLRRWIGSIKYRERGCGMWHLTSSSAHLLQKAP
jgi:hypothetical protein